MNMIWKTFASLLVLATMTGCQDQGFDLELHMPVEVDRIELTIDHASGVAPRHVGGRAYAIDLDRTGRATINSDWPITRYHRTVFVTPTKRLWRNEDVEVIDSGWRMNSTTTRTPRSVTSKTKIDGSVFWMEIKKK